MPAITTPTPMPSTITLPTLSVRQPYAWGIAAGLKRVENRSWPTTHRGPLAIHAASAKPRGMEPGWEAIKLPNGELCGKAYVLSAIVAVVDIIGCVPIDDLPGEYEDVDIEGFEPCGPWCWLIGKVWRLPEPVAYKGKLSLWKCQLQTTSVPGFVGK